jgi:hypothetical protein
MKILAYTPTIRQRGTVPYRIILAERAGAFSEYVVWTENMDDNGDPTGCHGGHYFPIMRMTQAEAFKEAHKKFVEKSEQINRYIAEGNFTEIL